MVVALSSLRCSFVRTERERRYEDPTATAAENYSRTGKNDEMRREILEKDGNESAGRVIYKGRSGVKNGRARCPERGQTASLSELQVFVEHLHNILTILLPPNKLSACGGGIHPQNCVNPPSLSSHNNLI